MGFEYIKFNSSRNWFQLGRNHSILRNFLRSVRILPGSFLGSNTIRLSFILFFYCSKQRLNFTAELLEIISSWKKFNGAVKKPQMPFFNDGMFNIFFPSEMTENWTNSIKWEKNSFNISAVGWWTYRKKGENIKYKSNCLNKTPIKIWKPLKGGKRGGFASDLETHKKELFNRKCLCYLMNFSIIST